MLTTLLIISISALLLKLIKNRYIPIRNCALLIILLCYEYWRSANQYSSLVSSSLVNFTSVALYFSVLFALVDRDLIKSLTSAPFSYIFYFWTFYFATSFFSIPIYGVNVKFIVLNSLKVLTFLSLTVKFKSLKEVYFCICFFLFFGTFDIFFNFTSYFLPDVIFNSRFLGTMPWLRIDTIWIAQAILASRIVLLTKKYRSNVATSFFKTIFHWAFAILLLITICYGIFFVQLRVQAFEAIIGFMVVAFLYKKIGFKLLIYLLIFIIVVYFITINVDPFLKRKSPMGY